MELLYKTSHFCRQQGVSILQILMKLQPIMLCTTCGFYRGCQQQGVSIHFCQQGVNIHFCQQQGVSIHFCQQGVSILQILMKLQPIM